MLTVVLFVLLAFTQIALGQDAVAPDMFVEKSFLELLTDPATLAKFLALAVGIQVLLRGAAEGLTRISVITDAKWDNKLAYWLSEAAWVLGAIIGKFGYSEPKLVSQERIDQAAFKAAREGEKPLG